MRIKLLLAILLNMSFAFAFAQNDRIKREAYTLKLPVDEKQFYEQKVESLPFFVKENVLQIYPGEKLLIEAEIINNELKQP